MPGQHPRTTPVKVQSRLAVASPADFETIAMLFAELHQYNASLDAHFALAENWRVLLEEHFLRTYALPSALWLLAWAHEQPVGLLMAEQHLDSPLFRHRAWIELVALYVRASSRGTGLARLLMDEARRWAMHHGAECMQLYVTATNERARAFYRQGGWRPVQEIWRLEVHPRELREMLDDPSCGPDAERQPALLEQGHQFARETRRRSEQELFSLPRQENPTGKDETPMFFDALDPRRESNAQLARQIKTWVADELRLDAETTLLVTERQCSAPDCPPVETVVAVMQPEQPIRQYKIHKPLQEITLDDVAHLTTLQSEGVRTASVADEKEEQA